MTLQKSKHVSNLVTRQNKAEQTLSSPKELLRMSLECEKNYGNKMETRVK